MPRSVPLLLLIPVVGSELLGQGPTPLTCSSVAASTPAIRAEGEAELVGDVVIVCTGGQPAAPDEYLRSITFQVFTQPTINIASRLLADAGIGSFSEALLFIDEPPPADQTLCGSAFYPYSVPPDSGRIVISGVCGNHTGTGNGRDTYDPNRQGDGMPNRGNTYQARYFGANSLIWQGVPFDPPGTTGSRTIRITNIRVNAAQLRVPPGDGRPVQLFLSTSQPGVASPITPVPIGRPVVTVAIAQESLGFRVVDPVACLQCEPANADFAADASQALATKGTKCDGVAFKLRFSEIAFPSAFRRRNDARPGQPLVPLAPARQDVLGVGYQTESGFMKAASNGDRWPLVAGNGSSVAGTVDGTLGLADSGTRLMARFSGVPSGIQIWVETLVLIQPEKALNEPERDAGFSRLITADSNGGGPFQLTPLIRPGEYAGTGLAQVQIVNGAGSAVWEVIETDTTVLENMEARVVIAYPAGTGANLPGLGASSVSGSYAPLSTAPPRASASAPLPRFADTAVRQTMLTIRACRTSILFPFVSNQAGFDTGLAIVNTSKDPFGTAMHGGPCMVNLYGKVGASPVWLSFASPSISGGEHFVWSLSSGGAVEAAPGFQGYVIAQCQFQYGHGFAFFSDVVARRLALGYLALVMDEGKAPSRTGAFAETLGH